MELKDFISETLKQIMEGVKGAQEKASEMGGAINPRGLLDVNSVGVVISRLDEVTQLIQFDVVVTTNDTDKAKGGVGVFVGEVGIGVRGETETQSTAVNRIQFSIPVYLPTQKITNK